MNGWQRMKKTVSEWEKQHKYLTWYVAIVVTVVLVLRIWEISRW